jgi:hypothetical protein
MVVCGENGGFIQPPMYILFSPDRDQNVGRSLLVFPWKSCGATLEIAQAKLSSASQGGFHR